MDARYFANHLYRDFCIYKALAKSESSAGFRAALLRMAEYAHEDYLFWRNLSPEKQYRVTKLEVLFFKLLRKLLGRVFAARVLADRTKKIAKKYEASFGKISDPGLRRGLERALEREIHKEKELVIQLEESGVTFVGSIVLGVNDGLVELSGALVGFSFALHEHTLIASAGLITGVAASLSMASSAYMQARYEAAKNPMRAGMYTGIAYMAVVLMLVAPFFIFEDVYIALAVMFGAVFLIINALSFYGAILLERSFFRQAAELLIASVGVGMVAFIIGSLFRVFSGAPLF